jgi:hypothetical protein
MMSECKVCKERQTEINRILKAYKKDKKIYMIAISCLIITNFFTLAYGKAGISMLFNFIKDKF